MENRRGKRGAAAVDSDPAKSTKPAAATVNTRASSKSPSRRSSRNRSPARNASPARTKSSSATQRRSARNKITDNDTASETDDSKSDILPKASIKLTAMNDGDIKSAQKSLSKARKTPTIGKGKASNLSDGDDEVASLTSKYLNDKLNAASGDNITPSDKRSYSRSMSRSLVLEDEWSQSDTSEKNDDPLYANRITRSRSKTQGNKLLRREQSLTNDAAAEFGGSIGALLLILLLPVLCFFTQYVCSRPECNIKAVRLEKLKLLSTYFTYESGYLYLGYTWIVCLLSKIPYLGIRRSLAQVTLHEQPITFYFNGLASAIAIVGGLAATEYYFKYPINTLIYKNYQQLNLVGIVYALIISIWCFARSAYFPESSWNQFAKSGRLVSDLFIGREITPRWLRIIDIKLVHRRISLIATLIFNLIFLSRNIKYVAAPAIEAPLTYTEIIGQHLQSLKLDPVAATVSILIIVYVLDALVFEHHLTSSFELLGEGVGAQLLLQYSLFPVWTSLFAKFALQHKISGVPNWFLAIVSILYIGGILLKRLSNELKYHYRINPGSSRSSSKFLIFSIPNFNFIFSFIDDK